FRSLAEETDQDDNNKAEGRTGGRHSSGGNRDAGNNDNNLGPLDRARLLQSKRSGASANSNNKNSGNDENGGGLTLDNAVTVDSDAEELDSS
ncbi:unnamed protein product, partial [Laminaria digitata]